MIEQILHFPYNSDVFPDINKISQKTEVKTERSKLEDILDLYVDGRIAVNPRFVDGKRFWIKFSLIRDFAFAPRC